MYRDTFCILYYLLIYLDWTGLDLEGEESLHRLIMASGGRKYSAAAGIIGS